MLAPRLPWLRLALALVLAVGGLLAGLLILRDAGAPSPPERTSLPGLLPERRPLPPFQLTDQNKRPFDLEPLRGRWTFLSSGYSHCPDICPATPSVMNTVSRVARKADVPPAEG